jgi:hypothetical protein
VDGSDEYSIDGAHPAGAWPVKPPWAVASAGEEGALAAATNRLAQRLSCHSISVNPARCARSTFLPSSWELGIETASLPCADTIRSDEMWHTGRLSFRVALGAACRCKGRRRRKPLGSQWRRRKLPVIWGYSGPFPCRFVETPNVTVSAWTQARTPSTNSNRPAFGEFLRRS